MGYFVKGIQQVLYCGSYNYRAAYRGYLESNSPETLGGDLIAENEARINDCFKWSAVQSS